MNDYIYYIYYNHSGAGLPGFIHYVSPRAEWTNAPALRAGEPQGSQGFESPSRRQTSFLNYIYPYGDYGNGGVVIMTSKNNTMI